MLQRTFYMKCHWIHKRCKKCLVYNTSADNFVIVCLWNDSIIWSVLWDIVETTSIVLAMRFKERTLKNSEMYRINITYKYTENIQDKVPIIIFSECNKCLYLKSTIKIWICVRIWLAKNFLCICGFLFSNQNVQFQQFLHSWIILILISLVNQFRLINSMNKNIDFLPIQI